MSRTILVVDDVKIVRRLVCVALQGCDDTDFLEAQDATEALKIAREHRGPIDLLLSDIAMPGSISGIETAVRLCQSRPETKVLLMSGYAPEALTIKPDWRFIQKPFAASEIRAVIRNIFADSCLAAY